MRQIVLDTETTGLEVDQGHRIIEIGCVELINRQLTGRHFHHYLDPERAIDAGAESVHGISAADLVGKPRFAQIVAELLEFLGTADLIIHNALFDLGFLNRELELAGSGHAPLQQGRTVIDTLQMARGLHPGQKNNLDALCKRHGIDNSYRELHGALLDAELLANVFLAMTGGQVALSFDSSSAATQTSGVSGHRKLAQTRPPLRVIGASTLELEAHRLKLVTVARAHKACALWPETPSMPLHTDPGSPR
ncbi:MAG: DNA polymerase III subunit epsilon [Porticoccaceae bacterium]|nr:DNA polymerase III subunit epsilon [Gammaproteobacteria bacterium]TAL05239.1 MAG: DNA polymerase III subunit epsilon [Porticoccaceae bacterium]